MTVLPPTQPDPMEDVVRKHLMKALEGQRGRAGVAFQQAILRADGGIRKKNLSALKLWATMTSAIAAGLAVMITLQMVAHSGEKIKNGANLNGTGQSVSKGGGTPLVADGSVPVMDQVELSREVDGGTAMVQDDGNGPATPVRVVRQQTLRQSQWFDPNEKATYQVTQPVETVNYQQIQPY